MNLPIILSDTNTKKSRVNSVVPGEKSHQTVESYSPLTCSLFLCPVPHPSLDLHFNLVFMSFSPASYTYYSSSIPLF